MLKLIETIESHKTVAIYGLSGHGKSQFIITFLTEALKLNPLIINNLDCIRNFKENVHSAILFDDCAGWAEKCIPDIVKLIDFESPTTHSVKHSSVTIPKPTPRVILGNPAIPHVFMGHSNDLEPINRRLTIIILTKDSSPLFAQTSELKEKFKSSHTYVEAPQEVGCVSRELRTFLSLTLVLIRGLLPLKTLKIKTIPPSLLGRLVCTQHTRLYPIGV